MAIIEWIRALSRQWALERDKPELLKAQYKAFARKIPMMYLILVINSWALAYTHLHIAPTWLAVYYPMVLTLLCLARFVFWWRNRNTNPSAEQAWKALSRTNLLVAPISLSFSLWAVLLFPYGGPYAQAHVAFYMGITIISCIFCLMYLRSAALTASIIVNGMFTVFFVSTQIPTFVAAALNVALVTVAMLAIVTSHYRDFTQLIDAQVTTAALSNENLQLANIDSLTQIPNRRKFFASLENICAQAQQQGTRFSIAILDLDGFKSVNDLHGHSYGDKLLTEAGQRLLQQCDAHVHLARLGGDEFALIIDADLDDGQLHALGNRLCETLRQPFVLFNTTVQVAASIGVATFPDMAADAHTLYEHADYALYHGKRARRGTVTLFSAEDKAQIQQNANIEQALRLADFEQELTVYFQPIVRLADGKTVAFEALARWHSPIIGSVSPAEFIPAAERMGIINRITLILLNKAIQATEHWPTHIRMSFNLSANDINSPDALDTLVVLIGELGLDPRRLDLEITETATLYDLAKTKSAITSLRELGCGVTLDDFGTGYSSLSQLHALPLSKIKIDRNFVTDIEHDQVSYKIVKSVLALSRDMNLACVVEGVETVEQLAILKEVGAVFAQGYLFSRPVTLAGTLKFI